MAEEQEGKTEPATARRRQEAVDSGRLPRSSDLTSAVLLLTGLIALNMTGQSIVERLAGAFRALLGNQYWGDQQELMDNALRMAGRPIVQILWPIMLAVFVASLLVNILQTGWRLTTKPLMPNFTRLNPFAGLSRLFAKHNWFQLVMNLTKLITVSAVAYARIRVDFPQILSLSGVEFPNNMALGFGIVMRLAMRIAIALLILAILDWIYQRWKFERDIRMSKQEVKDEAKMMEGDMAAKGRRRSLARRMILQRIHSDVPRADVVVTNPTHLAVALKYDPEKMGAPRVVAKGADYLALRIRQVAVTHGVPIVERKALAQALYKGVEVGQEVPPHLYQAIAEILAYVYELSGKGKKLRKAG